MPPKCVTNVPVAPPLQRAALACLARADALLACNESQPEQMVHDLRRELKRTRAILRIWPEPRPAWLDALYTDATALARLLSARRDRHVAVDVLEWIRKRHPRVWADLFAPDYRRPRAVAPLPQKSVAGLAHRIASLHNRLRAHPPPPCGLAQLTRTLHRNHRIAASRRERAAVRPVHENVHAWRKAIVRLRHQLDSVRPLLTPAARKLSGKLRSLAESLGRCGDLALVERRVIARGTTPLRVRQLAWLRARRRRFAAKALARGTELLVRRPRSFFALAGA